MFSELKKIGNGSGSSTDDKKMSKSISSSVSEGNLADKLQFSPSELTFSTGTPSTATFTVTNSENKVLYVQVKHPTCLDILPKGKQTIKYGESQIFTVDYNPFLMVDNEYIELHYKKQALWMAAENCAKLKLNFTKGPMVPQILKSPSIGSRTDARSVSSSENTFRSEALECKICLLNFNEDTETPRILSCGHTICQKCAISMLQDGKNKQITCPFDRTSTKVTNHDVKTLPKNFTVLELLDAQNSQLEEDRKSIDSNSNKTVNPCSENPNHEATVFCENCEIDLCDLCFETVHTPKVLSNHVKLSMTDRPMKFPKCQVHSYNTVEFMCKAPSCPSSSKLMCHTCILGDHKGHSYDILTQVITENRRILSNINEEINMMTMNLSQEIQNFALAADNHRESSAEYKRNLAKISEHFEMQKIAAMTIFKENAMLEKSKFENLKSKKDMDKEKILKYKEEVEKLLKSKNCFNSIEAVVQKRAVVLNGMKFDKDKPKPPVPERSISRCAQSPSEGTSASANIDLLPVKRPIFIPNNNDNMDFRPQTPSKPIDLDLVFNQRSQISPIPQLPRSSPVIKSPKVPEKHTFLPTNKKMPSQVVAELMTVFSQPGGGAARNDLLIDLQDNSYINLQN